MPARNDRLQLVAAIVTCATLAVALRVVPYARTGDTIRIWKIGSPHRGDTPAATVPFALRQEWTRRGFRISVEAFPAHGFAETFVDAVTRNAAPDVLVFDNFGVMDGITTALGKFNGIGQEPTVRRDLIRVTGAFDDLLGPERGWTYLFASSPNHNAARTLALRSPECPNGSSEPQPQDELVDIVPKLATAYLERDEIGIQMYSDPDRLSGPRSKADIVAAGAVRTCGMWGNDKLAFAWVNASYDAETTIGHTLVLLVLRKPAFQWQLLVAARDPISNGTFVKEVPSIIRLMETDGETHALPAPATLLSPGDGHYPRPPNGQRFGTFRWRSSPSADVVAEIAEFAYHDDARLFLVRPTRPGSRGQISAGRLWTTRSDWTWRVWSLTRAGDVVFSDAWTFPH